jgi:hypothetical protein
MIPSGVTGSTSVDHSRINPEETPLTPKESSSSGTGPYKYSNEYPIKEISSQEVAQVAQEFSSSISEYATDHEGQPITDQYSSHNDAKKWNERNGEAQSLADDIGMDTTAKTFSYNLGGHSVALMSLTHTSPDADGTRPDADAGGTRLDNLATHPGTSGAGKTMIEHAVNESAAAGNHGIVTLTSLNDASTGFYHSVGFKQLSGSDISDMKELNPSESNLWSQGSDGKWGLKEHKGSGFLSEANSSKRPREEEGDEATSTKRPRI